MNLLVIGGRLGRDAESATTATGKQVVKFSVAVDTGYGDNKKTIWIRCQKWGNTSSALLRCLKKGAFLILTGRLDSYKDKNNVMQFQMIVDSLELGGSKAAGSGDTDNSDSSEISAGLNSDLAAVDDDGTVPF